MKKIDINEVKNFYEALDNVWPQNNSWHNVNQANIFKFVNKVKFNDNDTILNAGSGGTDYGLKQEIYNIDIAENKNKLFKHFVQGNIEATPFDSDYFDAIICVGSVINYCDAGKVISEFSRIIKSGGKLIVEFESSYSFELFHTNAYMKSAELITTSYFNMPHKMWVYSPKYILRLLKCSGFRVCKTRTYHIFSSLAIYHLNDENKAAKYAALDNIFRYVPFVKWHSGNVIFKCIKN